MCLLMLVSSCERSIHFVVVDDGDDFLVCVGKMATEFLMMMTICYLFVMITFLMTVFLFTCYHQLSSCCFIACYHHTNMPTTFLWYEYFSSTDFQGYCCSWILITIHYWVDGHLYKVVCICHECNRFLIFCLRLCLTTPWVITFGRYVFDCYCLVLCYIVADDLLIVSTVSVDTFLMSFVSAYFYYYLCYIYHNVYCHIILFYL